MTWVVKRKWIFGSFRIGKHLVYLYIHIFIHRLGIDKQKQQQENRKETQKKYLSNK